jgi:hypothetical protein
LGAWASGKLLGLTDAEFWEMTPREFFAVWEQYLDAEERADRRIGMLYTMYYNAHRAEHAPAQSLDELFPRRHAARVERIVTSGKVLRSPEEQIEMIQNFMGGFGGRSR